MAREDKASATSSTQDAPSGKSGDQDSSSLAARRARLRGTLAKQSVPPDAYNPEPYQLATEPSTTPNLSATCGPVSPLSVSSLASAIADQPSAIDAPLPESEIPSVDDLSPDAFIVEPEADFVDSVVDPVSLDSPAEQPIEVSPMAAPKNARAERGAKLGENGTEPNPTNMPPANIPAVNMEDRNPFSSEPVAPQAASNSIPDLSMLISPSQLAAINAASVADSEQQGQVIELLNNLDQQLGICSVNMAQISKAANEQLEIVRNLAETIQHQAFNEIGLSLNSLSESMSAALEPMQAVGELVPAIDNLVISLESKNTEKPKTHANLTPEELVHSLADQLSTGKIDPWTFKCAYMAVFPSEHPADLLRKLVDLLGAQRISGDFFRAAYDAVQAPDPPKPVYTLAGSDSVREVEVVRVVQDETVLAQIEELRQQNEEMRSRMDNKEQDFAELLAAKDQEVQDTQEMLNSRWEEFSGQYEKLSDLVQQRNDLIQAKEVELSHKDSEITQLKTQLDEMRDQTRDMVADLQRQLTTTKAAADEAAQARPPVPKPSTSFFEQPQPAPAAPLFNEAPKQLFAEPQQVQQQQQVQPQVQQSPQATQQNPVISGSHPVVDDPMQTQAPAPVDLNAAQNQAQGGSALNQAMPSQAIPRPQVSAPTTPFAGATGSYGSGVRAQVFEVIVRQALAGAPWREICAGPMQVNNISADEVEAEVKRRQALLKK